MSLIMRKYILLLALLFLMAGAAIFLPYKAWLEKRLELILEAKGFENVDLTISNVSLNSASFENVSIGGESQLNIKNIVLVYSPRELWNGYLRDLSVSGVTVDLRQDNGRWVVVGLEGLSKKPESNISEPLAVPITPENLARIPFEHLKFEDSLLNIIFEKGKLSLPLDLRWEKSPQSQLTYKGENLAFKFNAFEAGAESLTLDAYVNDKGGEWTGPWALKGIIISGTPIPLPLLSGAGAIAVNQGRAEIKGKLNSEDKSWNAEFNLHYDFMDSEKSTLTVLRAVMPWKEGRIEVRNVKIPFTDKAPIKIPLKIERVSVQELMGSLTGGRVEATGKVSGTLPLIIGRDGQISILPGNLKSEGPGTISMPPDSIPGDNEQVALVRQILEDLKYTGLSITLKNDKSGRLGILMSFEGNNPAVYNGRPVKLNVNLTGDVIEFIQQNLLLFTSPEQLLRQGNHGKN
ncbi:MAG: YdbH domain-containing protein [Alphaproteobacteria bacterium]|nr:YdbH domain-containing protein [Alphaproteobacteria bacterium]